MRFRSAAKRTKRKLSDSEVLPCKEISQDNLSVLKFEFRLEILGVCSESFNLLFQTTGVLIDNDILYFESPYYIYDEIVYLCS
jgi:hypothetical protein